MASYQDERRVEYRNREYGSSSPRSFCDGYSYQNSFATGGYGNPKPTYWGSYQNSSDTGGYGQPKPTYWGSYPNSSDTGGCGTGGGDLFGTLVPSAFPPGTDQMVVECFNRIDKDRNGFICDQELQSALSSIDHRFSMRTVHLLMHLFTGSNSKKVGPKEFIPLVQSLQRWKAMFQRFDRNRNGRMDAKELKGALMSLGFNISHFAVELLVSKFDKAGGKNSIEYDNFIECCLVVKGLTEKFKCKEDPYSGTASFSYDEFLLGVFPFIVA